MLADHLGRLSSFLISSVTGCLYKPLDDYDSIPLIVGHSWTSFFVLE